jgi:hypothetical protein
MAKKGSGDLWALGLGALIVGVILYHARTGEGDENNSALIPDSIERDLDRVVGALNQRFGHEWIDAGIYWLRSHIRRVLPQLVLLVDVVSEVELAYRNVPKTGPTKKQVAAQKARSLRLS